MDGRNGITVFIVPVVHRNDIFTVNVALAGDFELVAIWWKNITQKDVWTREKQAMPICVGIVRLVVNLICDLV